MASRKNAIPSTAVAKRGARLHAAIAIVDRGATCGFSYLFVIFHQSRRSFVPRADCFVTSLATDFREMSHFRRSLIILCREQCWRTISVFFTLFIFFFSKCSPCRTAVVTAEPSIQNQARKTYGKKYDVFWVLRGF